MDRRAAFDNKIPIVEIRDGMVRAVEVRSRQARLVLRFPLDQYPLEN